MTKQSAAQKALDKALVVQGNYRVNKHLQSQFLMIARLKGTSGSALIADYISEYVEENLDTSTEAIRKATKSLNRQAKS